MHSKSNVNNKYILLKDLKSQTRRYNYYMWHKYLNTIRVNISTLQRRLTISRILYVGPVLELFNTG